MADIPTTGMARIEIIDLKNHAAAIQTFLAEVRVTYRGNNGPPDLNQAVKDIRQTDFTVVDGWMEIPVDEFAPFNLLAEDFVIRGVDPTTADALETLNVEFV